MSKPNMLPGESLRHGDILDLLTGFSGAIELDQLRVEAVPTEHFHHWYDAELWRDHRKSHLVLIDKLSASVNESPVAMLAALTGLAIAYEAAVVREAMVDLFSCATTGIDVEEGVDKATVFFSLLIKNVGSHRPKGYFSDDEPRRLMMQWLTQSDPLCIAEDPECGYGRPSGFVH